MTLFFGIVLFAGGYAASVFTWEPIHTWLVGAKAKIAAFEQKIKDLKAKL